MAATKTQTVPALDRALSILELLSQSRTGLGLPEIVERTGLPRSTVHYLVVTLERRGYVQRNERTARYLFGVNMVNLAASAVTGLGLRQQAAPFLQQLMRRTQLTVHMGVLSEREAILVSRHDPARGSRMATWVGKRMDLHCTALGKALAACLSEEELSAVLREHGLARHNDNTIASGRKLREELAGISQLGYSVDDEEDELGTRCIGAPILDRDRKALAAISIAGTCAEVNEFNYDFLVRETRRTAADLALALTSPDAISVVPKACEASPQYQNAS